MSLVVCHLVCSRQSKANSSRRNRVCGPLAEFGCIELQAQDSGLGEVAIDFIQLAAWWPETLSHQPLPRDGAPLHARRPRR